MIHRNDMDAFSLIIRRAAPAQDDGRFAGEIIPLPTPGPGFGCARLRRGRAR